MSGPLPPAPREQHHRPSRPSRPPRPVVPPGLVIVDKPAGWTSHDVVARVRKIFGTRKVGHAGTLDPMATGVLVLGLERATKLLGHLALHDKAYLATIRLGATTSTDDIEGEILSTADASGVDESAINAEIGVLTGAIEQVPSSVSAVKINGKRAYQRVRDGEQVELAARPVVVHRFDLLTSRRLDTAIELDVLVECSAGTYVRALARDLGAALGVGGHLTALRRSRVGSFGLRHVRTLEQLADDPVVSLDLDSAVGLAFPRREVSKREAAALAHGQRLPVADITGTYAVFGPDGHAVALAKDAGEHAKAVLVLTPAG